MTYTTKFEMIERKNLYIVDCYAHAKTVRGAFMAFARTLVEKAVVLGIPSFHREGTGVLHMSEGDEIAFDNGPEDQCMMAEEVDDGLYYVYARIAKDCDETLYVNQSSDVIDVEFMVHADAQKAVEIYADKLANYGKMFGVFVLSKVAEYIKAGGDYRKVLELVDCPNGYFCISSKVPWAYRDAYMATLEDLLLAQRKKAHEDAIEKQLAANPEEPFVLLCDDFRYSRGPVAEVFFGDCLTAIYYFTRAEVNTSGYQVDLFLNDAFVGMALGRVIDIRHVTS